MNDSVERSLKDRVKQIARREQRAFNAVWQGLVIERFLARLARSPYRENFIFKGGLLLSYYVKLGRETTDLDLLLRGLQNHRDSMLRAIEAVFQIDLGDGFTFTLRKVDEIDHLQTPYPGFAVSLTGICGATKTDLSLDIGVGDVVDPRELKISLSSTEKQPVFEPEISLLVYPPESIFAEKLETALFRGMENSRMKDYHDLWILILSEQPVITNPTLLKRRLEETFVHRGTQLGPIPLPSDSGRSKQEQYWQAYLRTLDPLVARSLPGSFREIVEAVNIWLRENIGIE